MAAPYPSFAGAARRFWLEIFPRLRRERRAREARARDIPDEWLREVAMGALGKWGNVEGAAAFSTLVPHRHRLTAARAMSTFQAAYSYLDMLAETRRVDAARTHRALVCALSPSAPQPDYYAHSGLEDGGYLREMVQECRASIAELPSYGELAGAALRAGERIVAFQSIQGGEREQDEDALCAWGAQLTPRGLDVEPCEAAAAAGSSLCVYALLAAAGNRHSDSAVGGAIERAYFPWIGALHSLLDNLVDLAEDRANGQHNLISCYRSTLHAAWRMRRLAREAAWAAGGLPDGEGHVLILAAMASFYLSSPHARSENAEPVAKAVLEGIGEQAKLPMRVFKLRRALGRQPC